MIVNHPQCINQFASTQLIMAIIGATLLFPGSSSVQALSLILPSSVVMMVC